MVSAASFSGQGYEVVIDDEAAGVITGSVGTGVLISVVGSVGAALVTAPAAGVTAASASSSSSSSSVGDPLALIFSVQSIAVMSKVGSLPASYTSFAEVLNIFIFKLAPPRAVREWLRPKKKAPEEGARRLGASYRRPFADDSDASGRFCGNLFWSLLTLVGTVTAHLAYLGVARMCSWEVPGILQLPHGEIKVLLALSMGVLDASIEVLWAPDAAWGWKAVAAMELCATMLFITWFFQKGRQFRRDFKWLPLSNIRRRSNSMGRRRALQENVLSGNGDDENTSRTSSWDEDAAAGFLTKPEVVAIARKELGMSAKEGEVLFHQMDTDGSGVLEYPEFAQTFLDRGLRPKVPFERTTVLEGLAALLFSGRAETGRWIAKDSSVDDEFGRHFYQFSPMHVKYYPRNILFQAGAVLLLTVLGAHAVAQAACLCALALAHTATVVWHAPYALLGQARSEMVSYLALSGSYGLALLAAVGAMPSHDAAAAVVVVQVGGLAQAIVSSIYLSLVAIANAAVLMAEPIAALIFPVAEVETAEDGGDEGGAGPPEVLVRTVTLEALREAVHGPSLLNKATGEEDGHLAIDVQGGLGAAAAAATAAEVRRRRVDVRFEVALAELAADAVGCPRPADLRVANANQQARSKGIANDPKRRGSWLARATHPDNRSAAKKGGGVLSVNEGEVVSLDALCSDMAAPRGRGDDKDLEKGEAKLLGDFSGDGNGDGVPRVSLEPAVAAQFKIVHGALFRVATLLLDERLAPAANAYAGGARAHFMSTGKMLDEEGARVLAAAPGTAAAGATEPCPDSSTRGVSQSGAQGVGASEDNITGAAPDDAAAAKVVAEDEVRKHGGSGGRPGGEQRWSPVEQLWARACENGDAAALVKLSSLLPAHAAGLAAILADEEASARPAAGTVAAHPEALKLRAAALAQSLAADTLAEPGADASQAAVAACLERFARALARRAHADDGDDENAACAKTAAQAAALAVSAASKQQGDSKKARRASVSALELVLAACGPLAAALAPAFLAGVLDAARTLPAAVAREPAEEKAPKRAQGRLSTRLSLQPARAAATEGATEGATKGAIEGTAASRREVRKEAGKRAGRAAEEPSRPSHGKTKEKGARLGDFGAGDPTLNSNYNYNDDGDDDARCEAAEQQGPAGRSVLVTGLKKAGLWGKCGDQVRSAGLEANAVAALAAKDDKWLLENLGLTKVELRKLRSLINELGATVIDVEKIHGRLGTFVGCGDGGCGGGGSGGGSGDDKNRDGRIGGLLGDADAAVDDGSGGGGGKSGSAGASEPDEPYDPATVTFLEGTNLLSILPLLTAEAGGTVSLEEVCNAEFVSDKMLLGFNLNKAQVRRFRRAVQKRFSQVGAGSAAEEGAGASAEAAAARTRAATVEQERCDAQAKSGVVGGAFGGGGGGDVAAEKITAAGSSKAADGAEDALPADWTGRCSTELLESDFAARGTDRGHAALNVAPAVEADLRPLEPPDEDEEGNAAGSVSQGTRI